NGMEKQGGELAKSFISFFMGDTAEDVIGDKVGWLAGTIVFQLVLDFFTAGTWTGAMAIIKGIAEFINWPMKVFGKAFKLLGKLGRYLLDGAKSLGSVIKDAAAGALKMVGEAIGRLGEKLWSFVERMIGRFGKYFEKEAGAIEEGTEKLLGKGAQEGSEKA